MFKNKNFMITLMASLFIIQIAAAPKLCIDSAVNGALLFFYKVFPSLFPFLVIANLILSYDGVHIYSKIFGKLLCRPLGLPEECGFVVIISMLCGYPLGAKYSCDLYERMIIDKETFIRLLNIASNPSPIFILGTVGISMLNNNYTGYILLFSCYLSCMVMGIILPGKKTYKKSPAKTKHTFIPVNFGNALKSSVDNAISTCISIGGFVVIFSVINTYAGSRLAFNTGIIKNIFIGIIEMTNGCSLIAGSDSELYIKLIIISFILSFSGFSIISQVYSFTARYKVSMLKYMAVKAIQGVICAFITYVTCKFILADSSVFASNITFNAINLELPVLLILTLLLPFVIYKILFKFS